MQKENRIIKEGAKKDANQHENTLGWEAIARPENKKNTPELLQT